MNTREQFEAAWHKEYPLHSSTAFTRSGFDPERYANTRVQDGWLMWQAAILQATTRDAITPYAYVYEWDYSPGVVHRSFSSAPYNGRRPDRTIQVFKAPKGDGND